MKTMKKMFALLTLMAVSAVFAGYEQWDIVEDVSWQDSDGGAPVQRSLHDLIDQGKVVLLTWGYNT